MSYSCSLTSTTVGRWQGISYDAHAFSFDYWLNFRKKLSLTHHAIDHTKLVLMQYAIDHSKLILTHHVINYTKLT